MVKKRASSKRDSLPELPPRRSVGNKKSGKIAVKKRGAKEIKTGPLKKDKLSKLARVEVENRAEKKESIKEDVASLVSKISARVKERQVGEQRSPILGVVDVSGRKQCKKGMECIFTGIDGFDDLLEEGIPKGASVLVAGGAGSGKTIFCLQTLCNQAKVGKKCLYMTFEEGEPRLMKHMEDFGWEPEKLIKKGMLKIYRASPFDITRNVDALLAKEKGELLIDVDPVIIPRGFKPDFIVVDSLTAIASAFTGKEENYRVYIEQLFRFFEKIGATSFLITETEQIPKIFSPTGVEEFLADGVIVLYSIKHENVRENAIEVLKLRGVAHKKKIVAMQITEKGIKVYPQQEIFSELE